MKSNIQFSYYNANQHEEHINHENSIYAKHEFSQEHTHHKEIMENSYNTHDSQNTKKKLKRNYLPQAWIGVEGKI